MQLLGVSFVPTVVKLAMKRKCAIFFTRNLFIAVYLKLLITQRAMYVVFFSAISSVAIL